MWLLALFIAVPIIEIALFIQVGGAIGTGPTLLIVLITAILGTWLVRSQGALAMTQLRQSFNEMRDPSEPLAHGAMILFSGALLLTPGFFTDAVGFALLVPGVRSAVFKYLRSRIKVAGFTATSTSYSDRRSSGPDVIEGEFEEIDPTKRPTHKPSNGPSGWTRH